MLNLMLCPLFIGEIFYLGFKFFKSTMNLNLDFISLFRRNYFNFKSCLFPRESKLIGTTILKNSQVAFIYKKCISCDTKNSVACCLQKMFSIKVYLKRGYVELQHSLTKHLKKMLEGNYPIMHFKLV